MNNELKPGDEVTWRNEVFVVYKNPYEFSVLCRRKNMTTGIVGIPLVDLPCQLCDGRGFGPSPSVFPDLDQYVCDRCNGSGKYVNNVFG